MFFSLVKRQMSKAPYEYPNVTRNRISKILANAIQTSIHSTLTGSTSQVNVGAEVNVKVAAPNCDACIGLFQPQLTREELKKRFPEAANASSSKTIIQNNPDGTSTISGSVGGGGGTIAERMQYRKAMEERGNLQRHGCQGLCSTKVELSQTVVVKVTDIKKITYDLERKTDDITKSVKSELATIYGKNFDDERVKSAVTGSIKVISKEKISQKIQALSIVNIDGTGVQMKGVNLNVFGNIILRAISEPDTEAATAIRNLTEERVKQIKSFVNDQVVSGLKLWLYSSKRYFLTVIFCLTVQGVLVGIMQKQNKDLKIGFSIVVGILVFSYVLIAIKDPRGETPQAKAG